MYPIALHISRLNIYTHGVLIAIGAIVAGLALYKIAKKQNYRTDFIFDLIVFSLFGGIIGSRILYIILYHNQFASFKEMLYIWNGGLVSFGGIIGGLAVAYFLLRSKKESFVKWFDLGIIALMIGWAFGRIGCLLNGDSYGIISLSKINIWGRIPTQLFESIWSLLIAVLCYLTLRFQEKWRLPDGVIFLEGIGLYSLGRFVVDFWRDEPEVFWFLKAGQIGSLVILIISIVVILILIKTGRSSNGSN